MVSHMSLLGTDVLHEIIFGRVSRGSRTLQCGEESITAQQQLMSVKKKI